MILQIDDHVVSQPDVPGLQKGLQAGIYRWIQQGQHTATSVQDPLESLEVLVGQSLLRPGNDHHRRVRRERGISPRCNNVLIYLPAVAEELRNDKGHTLVATLVLGVSFRVTGQESDPARCFAGQLDDRGRNLRLTDELKGAEHRFPFDVHDLPVNQGHHGNGTAVSKSCSAQRLRFSELLS